MPVTPLIAPPTVPYSHTQLREYHGLMLFYHELHGDEWAPWVRCSKDGSVCWGDPDVHYCDWPVVHCFPGHPLTENSTVAQTAFGDPFDTRDPGLRGELSDAWLEEGRFETWDAFTILHAHGLTGPIPRLPPNLHRVRLNNCSFSGPMPSFAEQPRLSSLDLNHNALSGPVPDELFTAHAHIIVLTLADNELSGAFPNVAAPILAVLKISDNRIESLPEDVVHMWPQLSLLDVAHNQLTVLPQLCAPKGRVISVTAEHNLIHTMGTWTDCEDMTKLDLSFNQLNEPFPELFQQTPFTNQLAYVNLSHNSLYGPLPPSVMCLAMSMFNVNSNRISGTVPLCQNGFTSPLQVFLASNNSLSGEIPQHFWDLSQSTLNAVDLSYNDLAGTIYAHSISIGAYNGAMLSIDLSHNPRLHADATGRNALGGGVFKVDRDGTRNDYQGLAPWYCHRVTFKGAEYVTLLADPSAFYYGHCECLKGFVGFPPDNCIPCPDHGDCNLGGSVVAWGKGFFPVLEQHNNTASLINLEACLDENTGGSSCCPSDHCEALVTDAHRDDTWCAPGMSGRMCAKCRCTGPHDCLFWNDIHCEPCDRPYFVVSIVIVCVTLLAVIIIGVALPVIQQRRREREKATVYNNAELESRNKRMRARVRMLAMQTVVLSFSQMVYPMARRVSKRSKGMNRSAQLLQWTHFMPTGGMPCVVPSMSDPVNEMTFVLFVPLMIIALLALISALRSVHLRVRSMAQQALLGDVSVNASEARQRFGSDAGASDNEADVEEAAAKKERSVSDGSKKSEDMLTLHQRGVQDLKDGGYPILNHNPNAWEWWACWSLRALNVMYFALVDKTMAVFHCTSDDTGDKYLSTRPYFACDMDGDWGRLVALGVVSLVVYVVGIPLLMGALLYRYAPHMERPSVNYIFGPLVRLFRRTARMHQVVILMRRLVVATLLSFLSIEDSWQALGLTTVLVLALVEQLVRKPFRSVLANRMEVVSLIVLLNMSTLMHSDRQDGAVNLTLGVNWTAMAVMSAALFHEYYMLAAAVAVEKRGFAKIGHLLVRAPHHH